MFTAPTTDEALDQSTGFTAPAHDEPLDPEAKKTPEPEGFFGTAGREFASKIAPAVGTALGGLSAGTLALESGPGAIVADIAAGTAAGMGTEALQKSVMGKEWSDQNLAQMEANAQANPHAATLGAALPFIISALGGGGIGRAVAKKAEKTALKGLADQGVKEVGEEELSAIEADALKKAEASFLPSATAFARSQAASEGEKQVQQGEFKPGEIAGQAVLGGATGGIMHYIPGGDLHSAKTWGDLAKKALLNVTGKAAGDATTMVVANKAYDHFINGKPFDMSDVVGDSAAATVDFALLNAFHAGIAAHRFSKNANLKKEADIQNAASLADQVPEDLAPQTKAAAQSAVDQAGATPVSPEAEVVKEPEVTPVPEVVIPPIQPPSEASASIPIMVTKAMEGQLASMGYSPEEVNAMKPEEAHAVISGGIKKPITPTTTDLGPPGRTQTPPAASEGPSAVPTLPKPQDAPEAKEATKESKSGAPAPEAPGVSLTPEEESQVRDGALSKLGKGVNQETKDRVVADAMHTALLAKLNEKYSFLKEVGEKAQALRGGEREPQVIGGEAGEFPPAPEAKDRENLTQYERFKMQTLFRKGEGGALLGGNPNIRFEGATFKDPKSGKVHVARDHVTAAALAGKDATGERGSRETKPFGFKLAGQEEPIPRPLTADMVKSKHPQYQSGKGVSRRKLLHSDNLRIQNQMSLKDVPEFTEKGEPSQEKFEKAYQKPASEGGALHEFEESREEYLNRKICGG